MKGRTKVLVQLVWQPIESKKPFWLAFLLFGSTALAWQLAIIEIWRRGLGEPQPWKDMPGIAFGTVIIWPFLEETARGFFARLFGDKGLVIATFVWVLLHQFKRTTTPLRLIDEGIVAKEPPVGEWWHGREDQMPSVPTHQELEGP
ncbi:MAG: hypothetical protein HYU29_00845, partial [Chloroflexi bacterium]|nr:hypothetical protein [Chloroflexota bacterium]